MKSDTHELCSLAKYCLIFKEGNEDVIVYVYSLQNKITNITTAHGFIYIKREKRKKKTEH